MTWCGLVENKTVKVLSPIRSKLNNHLNLKLAGLTSKQFILICTINIWYYSKRITNHIIYIYKIYILTWTFLFVVFVSSLSMGTIMLVCINDDLNYFSFMLVIIIFYKRNTSEHVYMPVVSKPHGNRGGFICEIPAPPPRYRASDLILVKSGSGSPGVWPY